MSDAEIIFVAAAIVVLPSIFNFYQIHFNKTSVCRGGGPFGAGRLRSRQEVQELEEGLWALREVLAVDARQPSNDEPSSGAVVSDASNVATVAPRRVDMGVGASSRNGRAVATDSSLSSASDKETIARNSMHAPRVHESTKESAKESTEVATQMADVGSAAETESVPIALGLNAFLAAPEKSSVEVSVVVLAQALISFFLLRKHPSICSIVSFSYFSTSFPLYSTSSLSSCYFFHSKAKHFAQFYKHDFEHYSLLRINRYSTHP